MQTIDVRSISPDRINRTIKALPANEPCELVGCLGERFIGAGLAGRDVAIHGIPGNALGAYLDGFINAYLTAEATGNWATK